MSRGVFVLLIIVLSGVFVPTPVAAAPTGNTTDSGGEHSATKNEIMQLVLKNPEELSREQKVRAVNWLISNMDTLSQSDREAVREWLREAQQKNVSIPRRNALERALSNARASQTVNTDSNGNKTYDTSCTTRFSPSLCVTNETWQGDTVTLTLKADYPHRITITDSGAIISATNSNGGTKIPTKTVTVSSGYTRVSMQATDPPNTAPVITVSTGSGLWAFDAPRSGLWAFVIGQPTVALLRYAVAAGVVGTLLATLIDILYLRRKQRNKWFDLPAENYVSGSLLPGSPDGFTVGELAAYARDNKVWITGVAVTAGYYLSAYVFNHLPTVHEVWMGLSNPARLIVAGSVIAAVIAVIPAYLILMKFWARNYEYVFDLDAEEVVDTHVGDSEGAIGIYRGTPELWSDADISGGGSVTLRCSDGPIHLVRDFDPVTNEAEGVLDELHDDREVILDQSLIKSNHGILKSYQQAFLDLLGLIPNLKDTAEADALQRLQREFSRDHTYDDESEVDSRLREVLDDVGTVQDVHSPETESDEDVDDVTDDGGSGDDGEAVE